MWRACPRGLSGGYEVHLTGTRPTQRRRLYFVGIDDNIYGVLTLGHRGRRSGGDNRLRSSQTLFEGGSVVITAVAAMGGRGRTTGRDWLIVPAPGAGCVLTSVCHTSMVKRTNGARRVGGRASLSSVSVSPAVCTPRGAACPEGQFDVAFLGEDDDAGSKGRNVLQVDCDNHRSGVLCAPRVSACVKVPG